MELEYYVEVEIARQVLYNIIYQKRADFSSFKPYFQVKLIFNGDCFEYGPPLTAFIDEIDGIFEYILQSVQEIDFIELDFISIF